MSRFSKKLSGEEKTVAKNYGALTVLQALNYILPFLIIPFLERQLGLANFGLVMFAQSLMVFFILITDFGFNITATREIAILKTEEKDFSEVYFRVFWARIVLVILCFLFLVLLVFSFEKFRVDWELYLLSYGVVIGQAIFPVWFFQGIEKMRLITIVNVTAKVIFTVLLFFFIRDAQDYLQVPIFNSIGFIIAGILSLILSLKYVSWKKPDFYAGKAFYKESLSMFISNLSSSLYTSLNTFLLGIFGGKEIVGVYAAFEKLILASKNMFIPIYQAVYPYMARKSKAEMHVLMKKLFIVVTILGVAVAAVFMIFGEWILGLLFKDPKIVENVFLFKVMSLIALFSGLNMLFNVLYLPATKQFKKLMNIMIIAGVFNAILSMIIVPIYKIEGTVIAVVSTEFLLLLIALFLYRKEFKKTIRKLQTINMIILYLYSELMGYNVPVLKELATVHNAKIHVISWDEKKLTPIEIPSIKGVTFYKRSDFNKDSILNLAHKIQPDLVYVPNWFDKGYLPTCLAMRKKGIPVVAGLDNQWRGTLKQWAGCLLMRVKLKNYFSHLWVSGPYQYEFARRLGFKKSNIIFDFYSADVDSFLRKDGNTLSDSKTILFVGRLEPIKGIDLLLKAWESISDKKGWSLTLIGDGSLKNTIKNSDEITIKDFIQPEDLVKEIRDYSCFILPSIYEPYGVVLHEFAAAGMPIISSDCCGAAPIFVRSGYNGYQFKTGDLKDLISKLKLIINMTHEELEIFGERSLERSKVITPQTSAFSLISVLN